MTSAGTRVFLVRADALAELYRRIAALDRRAGRLGTGPIQLREIGRPRGGYVHVKLEGEPPVLEGWTLVGTVEHRGPGPALRALAPEGDLLANRFWPPVCDHCGLTRRRKRTYILLRRATGEVRQVGSRCLRDFVGGHDPEPLCRQAEYLALASATLADAHTAERPSGHPAVALSTFAAHAAQAVRAHGWVGRERALRTGESATADVALETLRTGPELPTLRDRERARRALAWGKLLADKPQPSEFERELIAVVALEEASGPRERALVCALIAVYAERRTRSRHLGRPGVAITLTLLVERVASRPSSRHGLVRRNELIDPCANRLVWWQTQGRPLEVGEVISLRGRIARHTRFGSANVTVLSHCRRVGGPKSGTGPTQAERGIPVGEPTDERSGR